MKVEQTGASVDHLGYLDGIRGGAALWVLLAHCGIWGGWMFMPDPKIAVDIFMVLSGYLMTYHYLARAEREPVNSWRTAVKFWVRRFFRIAPLYYLVLIGVLLLTPLVREGLCTLQAANANFWANHPVYDPHRAQPSVANVLLHVTFLFGLIPEYVNGVFLPDWSIGLEMQFYAVFPFLFLLFWRAGYVPATVACVVLSAGTNRWLASLPPFAPGTGFFPEPSFLPIKLPLFLIGMLAAESHELFRRNTFQRTLAIVLSLLLASRHSVYVVVTVAVILLLGVRREDANKDDYCWWRVALDRLLANRVAGFMADTSYAVYLLHGAVIALLGGCLWGHQGFLRLSPAVRVGILCLIVILVSYLLGILAYLLVEKPGISLGKKLVGRLSRQSARRARGDEAIPTPSGFHCQSSAVIEKDDAEDLAGLKIRRPPCGG